MTIPLQTRIVYGPLESRRFGKSLGINLLPLGRKLCNFDCVYCQYGEPGAESKVSFPSIAEIKKEFENSMRPDLRVDWIMISGNGEPTLHPSFSRAVDALLSLRAQYLPLVPIGILSNSSTCHRAETQDALMKLDSRFMKLDAGYCRAWGRLNRPSAGTKWTDMIGGLYHLKDLVLQSMFVTGEFDNTGEKPLEEWMRAVCYIQPKAVQIYSIDRPPKDKGMLPVAGDILKQISDQLTQRSGIPSRIFQNA